MASKDSQAGEHVPRLSEQLEQRVAERTAELERVNRELSKKVAELERAELASWEREEQFRALVEGIKDHAIFMLDPNGCVATWNSSAERVKGYKAEEIIG